MWMIGVGVPSVAGGSVQRRGLVSRVRTEVPNGDLAVDSVQRLVTGEIERPDGIQASH